MQRHAEHEYIIDRTMRPDAPLILQRFNRHTKQWCTFGHVDSRVAAEDGLEQEWQSVRFKGDCSVTIREFRAVVQNAEHKQPTLSSLLSIFTAFPLPPTQR